MLLTLLLLIHMLGVFTIFTGMSYELSLLNIRRIKTITLTISIIHLFVSLLHYILFDFSSGQFQSVQEYHKISSFDVYWQLCGGSNTSKIASRVLETNDMILTVDLRLRKGQSFEVSVFFCPEMFL